MAKREQRDDTIRIPLTGHERAPFVAKQWFDGPEIIQPRITKRFVRVDSKIKIEPIPPEAFERARRVMAEEVERMDRDFRMRVLGIFPEDEIKMPRGHTYSRRCAHHFGEEIKEVEVEVRDVELPKLEDSHAKEKQQEETAESASQEEAATEEKER